ncbi:MAG: NAD(P)H-dependent glycerol-3-phosphate dehydrogenase [Bacteroidota bacterium]
METSAQKTEPVGVIGAGSFGTAVSNLLAINTQVFLYSRRVEVAEAINQERFRYGVTVHENVEATSDLQEVTTKCQLLFIFVPSDAFRSVMKQLSPLLNPSHIIVHGTKGLDVTELAGVDVRKLKTVSRDQVHVMSSVIKEESSVVRVGIMSGPNLARELLDGQPTATLIASKFDEVIDRAKAVLQSHQLFVFGSYDLLGAELAGVLKNVIALGSGMLKGFGLGKNIQAMLITRGLHEMIFLGQHFGSSASAFLGTAGIGDLIATATSKKSRNFLFGFRLGSGESLEEVLATNAELAEGVRTLAFVNGLANSQKLRLPICQILYRIVYENMDMEEAMNYLMNYRYDKDVSFSI